MITTCFLAATQRFQEYANLSLLLDALPSPFLEACSQEEYKTKQSAVRFAKKKH